MALFFNHPAVSHLCFSSATNGRFNLVEANPNIVVFETVMQRGLCEALPAARRALQVGDMVQYKAPTGFWILVTVKAVGHAITVSYDGYHGHDFDDVRS